MPLLQRLNDPFATDPLSDPLYRFVGSWTYNGTLDRLEAPSNSSGKSIELLNSSINYGTIELDVHFSPTATNGGSKGYVRAFGYILVSMFNKAYIMDAENTDFIAYDEFSSGAYSPDYSNGQRRPALKQLSVGFANSRRVVRFVSTPMDTSIYVDGSLYFVGPSKARSSNVLVSTGSGSGNQDIYVYGFNLKADSSLPSAPQIVEPSEAGSINASQHVVTTIPTSRLFVDLGSYAPGITGLTNVVYDPGGANVAMTEDTGTPTRSGGTTGDFYLEIPSNGVAYDYRLVFKESFVTTNSVVTSDQVDFDVTGGPTGQTGTVTEDNDLHCYIHVFQHQESSLSEDSLINYGVAPKLHNYNADGNAGNINSGSLLSPFTGDSVAVSYNSSITFPVIIDLDLGKEYDLARINTIQDTLNSSYFTGFDIYSNTVPFSGASLAQGTLEETNYPVTALFNIATTSFPAPSKFPTAPDLSITTRYIRLVAPSNAYLNGAVSSSNFWPLEFDFRVLSSDSINTVDNNAQFEHDPGTGYVAFPAGGVTQGDGHVRITLPSGLQIASGERKFISVQFRADLTD